MRRRDPAAQVKAVDTATPAARNYWRDRTRRLVEEVLARRRGDPPPVLARQRTGGRS